jgi:hypothetical protein
LKSVIILGICDLKIIDDVTSAIYIVAAVLGVAVSRYYSPAVYMINGKESNYPNMGALVSP